MAINRNKYVQVTTAATAGTPGQLPNPPWYSDWDFSRASPVMAQTYDGLFQAFGSDEKAITDLGLFVSRASAQRVTTPLDPTGAGWISNGVLTPVETAVPGVDGVTPMWRVQANTGTSTHYVATPATSKTAGTRYGIACITSRETARYLQASFSNATHGETGYANFDTDMCAGGTAGSGVGSSYRITPLTKTLSLCEFSAPATITGSGRAFISMVPARDSARNPSFAGSGESFLFGGVVEYVGTTYLDTWQIADLLTTTLSKTIDPITGSFTLYVECFIPNAPAENARLVSLNNSSGVLSEAVEIGFNITAGARGRWFNGGTAVTVGDEGTPYQGYPKSGRYAITYNAGTGRAQLCINSVLVDASVPVTLPSGMNRIQLCVDQTGANRLGAFISDVLVERRAWSDDELRLRTARPMEKPAVPYFDTTDVQYNTRRFQGLPSLAYNASKTKAWGTWYGARALLSTTGEATGEFGMVGRTDDHGVTSTGEIAYLLPPNKYQNLFADPRMWRAPDGRVFLLYNGGGSGTLYDGRHGVWAVELTNPDAAAPPTFGTPIQLSPWGWCSRPFTAGGKVYIPISVWRGPSSVPPAAPGVPPGKHIFEWDMGTLRATYHSTLPTGANFTYDETAVCERDNGDWHAIWRTLTQYQQAVWNNATKSWGAASAFTAFTPTPDSRMSYQRSPYSGRFILVTNKSAPTVRSNGTMAISADGGVTFPWQYTFDPSTAISYFDGDCDNFGNWLYLYDCQRRTSVEDGLRQVRSIRLNEDAVIAGTETATYRVFSVPRGPAVF